MQDSSDIIRENNYILREIKQFKKRIVPENIEIIQDITEIHEIKDLKSKPVLQQVNLIKPVDQKEIKIRFEGETNDNLNDKCNKKIEDNKEGEEETILENEKKNNFVESIFEKLKNGDKINEFNDLKEAFNALKDEDKKEIIEGVRIKIDNEEQENRFNDLLKLLN